MESMKVGIRELKTNLSKYLNRVKEGQTLVITEHGKPIGRIVPEGVTVEARLKGLELSGVLLQTGSALPKIEPVTISQGQKLISEFVSEGRDVDYLS
jgi:prevent-host-death family protein